jgi:hypothetical protein
MRLLSVLLLVSAVSVSAQEPGAPPQAPPDMGPAEIQKIFDGYLLIQAQAALGLSDQQFAQFVPRLRMLQETRRRHQQERSRLLNELQRMTRISNARGAAVVVDEAGLKERLSSLQESDSRFAADMRKAYNALDEVLDVRQQARFRTFEDMLERRKLDLLMRARQGAARRGTAPR